MTHGEACFAFLVSLIATVVAFVFSVRERHLEPEYTNSQIKALLEEHVHSERDRAIAYDKLANKVTFEALAEKYNLSVRQTKQIVSKCRSIVFKHLG